MQQCSTLKKAKAKRGPQGPAGVSGWGVPVRLRNQGKPNHPPGQTPGGFFLCHAHNRESMNRNAQPMEAKPKPWGSAALRVLFS